jgi:hypothetical protein
MLAILGVLALLVVVGRSLQSGGIAGGSSGGLSPVRRRAAAILDELVPAEYPDARFARIVGAGFDPATSSGTTCGALPGRMGLLLGDPQGITKFGVAGVRDEGKAHGAWVDAASGRRPKLGDIYLTAYIDGPQAGWVAHTGIVLDATGTTWTTADAGQGPREKPRAERVQRQYDATTQTLSRGTDRRKLLGWINLDAWPFPRSARPIEAALQAGPYDYPCDPAECGADSGALSESEWMARLGVCWQCYHSRHVLCEGHGCACLDKICRYIRVLE